MGLIGYCDPWPEMTRPESVASVDTAKTWVLCLFSGFMPARKSLQNQNSDANTNKKNLGAKLMVAKSFPGKVNFFFIDNILFFEEIGKESNLNFEDFEKRTKRKRYDTFCK